MALETPEPEKTGNAFKDQVPPIPEGMSYEAALAEQGVVQEAPGEQHEPVVGAALSGALPQKFQKLTRMLAEKCALYLSFPTLTDGITDHDFRRGWRERMKDAFGERAKTLFDNRMRTNRMAPALSIADQLKVGLMELKERSPAVEGLLASIEALEASMAPSVASDDENAFSKEYEAMPKEAKLAKVSEISEAARGVLRAAAGEEEQFSKAA